MIATSGTMVGKEEPVVAGEADARDDRLGARLGVHRAALVGGIDERVHADLRQHARPLRRRLAMHVEQDAGRDVVGGDRVVADHLPDERRLGGGRAGGIGAGEHAGEAAGLGEMVDALDAPHVAGGDRVQRGEVARMALGVEPRADRREHRVGAAERRGRRHRDDRAVGDQAGRLSSGKDARLGHGGSQASMSIGVSRPDRAASSVASATLERSHAVLAARRRRAASSDRVLEQPDRARVEILVDERQELLGCARAQQNLALRRLRHAVAPDQRSFLAVHLEAGGGVAGGERVVELREEAAGEAHDAHHAVLQPLAAHAAVRDHRAHRSRLVVEHEAQACRRRAR